MRIRRATHADCDAMAGLLVQLFAIETDFTVDTTKQIKALHLLIDDLTTVVLVAEMDEKVVAMVTMQRLVSTAAGGYGGVIEDVVVDAQYRGRGIGRALLETLMTLARENGYCRLQLNAERNNIPACIFYRNYGFSRTSLILLLKSLHA